MKIKTSRGPKTVENAFSQFCEMIYAPTFDYSYLRGIFRRLPPCQKLGAAIHVIMAAKNDLNRSRWFYDPLQVMLLESKKIVHVQQESMRPRLIFPGSNRVELNSHWPYHGAVHATGMLAGIYNSGRHVYFSRTWPCEYKMPYNIQLLRFADFCGCGNWIGDTRIQHLGHLYGLRGGPAKVIITGAGKLWQIDCQPNFFYYVVDFGFDQAVFIEAKILTRPTLSHG